MGEGGSVYSKGVTPGKSTAHQQKVIHQRKVGSTKVLDGLEIKEDIKLGVGKNEGSFWRI